MEAWSGIVTALITPFKQNGDIDFDGYRANIARQIEAGVHAVVSLATAGEAPSMDVGERRAVLAAALEVTRGRIPVLAGVGGLNERETYSMIRYAEDQGAAGLFVITPYFYRLTRNEYLAYFRRISALTALPMLIYNSTYADTPLDPDTILRLTEIPNFVALKEGNQLQASEVIRRVGHRVAVFSSRDIYIFELLAAGGAGAISFTSNVAPEPVLQLYQAARSGQWERARDIQKRLNPLIWELVRRSYPAPLKAAMNLLGLAGGSVRLPLTDLTDEELPPLRDALAGLGLLKPAHR